MKRGSCSLTLEVLEVLCLFSLPAPSKCHVQVLTNRHSQNSTVHSTNCKCIIIIIIIIMILWNVMRRSDDFRPNTSITSHTNGMYFAAGSCGGGLCIASAASSQGVSPMFVLQLPATLQKTNISHLGKLGKSSTQKCPPGMGDASSQPGGVVGSYSFWRHLWVMEFLAFKSNSCKARV